MNETTTTPASETTATTNTYLVPDCNLAELETRIAKLNKRCRKLGVPEITLAATADHVKHEVGQLTTDGHINRTWRTSIEKTPVSELPATAYLANAFEPTGMVMTWHRVEVTGHSPKLADWRFIAVLEPLNTDEGTENLTRVLPGETCPAEFRTRIGECDHCNKHRNRKETFVVKHANGGHKCVGRNCLKDFLGYHDDPNALASIAEMLAELAGLCEDAGDEGWGGGSFRGRPSEWSIEHFLALAACRVRKHGWVSKAAANEAYERGDTRKDATANVVLEILTPPNFNDDQAKRAWAKLVAEHIVEEVDKANAEAAIEWAKELEAGDNDYLHNVNLVARVGTVSRRTAGIAASILAAHEKALGWEREAKERESLPESNWIGTEGERLKCLKVTVKKIIAKESAYGTTGIHLMNDENGNDLTWFATGSWLKEGETVHIAATVKAHDTYKERKKTVLTRVVAWTEEGLAAHLAKEEKKAARAAKKAAKESKKLEAVAN